MNKPSTGKAELIGLAKEHLELLKQCLTFSADLMGETLIALSQAIGMNAVTANECVMQIISGTPRCVLPTTMSVEQWQLSDLQGEVTHWATGNADVLASVGHSFNMSSKPSKPGRISQKLRRGKIALMTTLQQVKIRLDMKRTQLDEKARFTTDGLSRSVAALENLPVTYDLYAAEHLLRSIPDLAGLLLILAAPAAEVDRETRLDIEFTEPLPMWFLCDRVEADGPIDNKTFRKRICDGTYPVHSGDDVNKGRLFRILIDILPQALRNPMLRSEALANAKKHKTTSCDREDCR